MTEILPSGSGTPRLLDRQGHCLIWIKTGPRPRLVVQPFGQRPASSRPKASMAVCALQRQRVRPALPSRREPGGTAP